MKTRVLERCAISLLIVIGLCAVAIAGRFYFHNRTKRLVIVAVAHEWWWEFDYPGLGIKHAGELHLPVGIPIHFELTTADAFHSFWLPGLKHAVAIAPNTPSELNLRLTSAGHFYGNCDAGCGCTGVCMKFSVFADNAVQFTKWVIASRLAKSPGTAPLKNNAPPPCVLADSGQPASAPATSRLEELLEGEVDSLNTRDGEAPVHRAINR